MWNFVDWYSLMPELQTQDFAEWIAEWLADCWKLPNDLAEW
jgi:hypothetical protein